MRLHATRLQPGTDLKQAIVQFAESENITAGVMVSAVGSLHKAQLRMAGAQPDKQDVRELPGPFEIVSLVGTISASGEHLHMAISDQEGSVIGGHLKDGCIVETTVELVIAADEALQFTREIDPTTGFKELHIKQHD